MLRLAQYATGTDGSAAAKPGNVRPREVSRTVSPPRYTYRSMVVGNGREIHLLRPVCTNIMVSLKVPIVRDVLCGSLPWGVNSIWNVRLAGRKGVCVG